MPNPVDITSDLHSLIVNPGNSSLVLGAADYLTHRPLQWAARKLTGNSTLNLPGMLSPAKWGEHVARAGEKIDYTVGKHVGSVRKEDLKLTHEHLARVKATLAHYEGSSNPEMRTHGKSLRDSLDNLIKSHHDSEGSIEHVLNQHESNKDYALTLHGVNLPSATGEVGKHVKNFGTDAAAFVGTGHIMHQIQQAQGQPNSPLEDAHTMDPKFARIKEALDNLDKVAALLVEIPKRDEAHKRASDLCAAGAINSDEVEKYASVFYSSPEASDVLAHTVQRIAPDHAKSARLGEVVAETASYSSNKGGDTGGNGFDTFCLTGGRR